MIEGFKEVIHFECGKPAFLAADIKWTTETAIDVPMVRHLDGSNFKGNDVFECVACSHAILDIALTIDNHLIAISTNEGYWKYVSQLKKDLK